MNKIIRLMLLSCSAYGSVVFADNAALRSPTLSPRIGVMSEEVVRQKFAVYGQKILDLKHDGDVYHIRANVGGKEMQLDLNSVTGALKQAGVPFRLEASAQAANSVIKPDPQRVPWNARAIRFDKIGVRGLTPPTEPQR